MNKKTLTDELDLAQRQLAAILESSDDAMIGSAADDTIISWNAAAENLFGRKASDVEGKRLTLIMPRGHSAELARILKQVRKGKAVRRFETECLGKGERRVHAALTIAPISDRIGNVIGSITIVRDLSRRVRGQETILKRTRELLTFHKLSELILSPRPLEDSYNAIVREISSATGFPIVTIAILDESRQTMVFRGLMGFPFKSKRGVMELPANRTISGIIVQTGKPVVESNIREKPLYRSIVMGRLRAQTFVGYPMKTNGKIIGCLNLAHTESMEINPSTLQWIESLANYVAVLTERKRIEEELRGSQEQLRELSRETHSAIEEERRRIAREIHDQLGQELSLFQLELGLIQDQLMQRQEGLRTKLKSMSAMIDSSIKTVQRISTDLRPTLLDNVGVGAAVEWAVREFQKRTRIRCRTTLEPAEVKLDQERSTALFRILQEALTNVLRHANATRVRIRLVRKEDAVVLTIRDNGIGIPRQRVNDPKSVGLTGMRERVRPWGGKVTFTGELHKGTEVIINVPLKP